MTDDPITLGELYQDDITGFEGVAVGRSEYLNGCRQVLLEAMIAGEPKGHWFDEQRVTTNTKATAGGPQPAPPGPTR